MRNMPMKDDATERMRKLFNSKVKEQSGFAFLVAMLMTIAVSLTILHFALMS